MSGYTIYSYGNVDTLATLFNGMAALMGADGYTGAIAMVLILGFLGALFAMAFMKHMYGVNWLIAVFLINGVLLVPKSTIQIVDRMAGQAPVVIDNVPTGIAALASLVSSIGSTLTELFETAAQTLPVVLGTNATAALPADLTYEKTGMMFGATLIKEATTLRFSNPNFNADVVNFVANCTIYDISQGFIDAEDFVNKSTDLWAIMADTNPARFTTVHAADGSVDSYPCTQAYTMLDNSMTNQVGRAILNLAVRTSPALKGKIAGSVDPTMENEARTALEGQLSAAYTRALIGGGVADTAQIVRQNGLINAVRGAGLLFSQRTNDPSALMLGLAQAQTTAAMNAQKIVGGKIAEAALPMLHNAIQAVVYYSFPLVVLVALILGGMGALRTLKMYALSLVWLAMWPPLYAVVNYLHSTAAAKEIALAGYYDGVQGLTIATAPTIYNTTVSELAITSWLLVSVPLIASAIVFGMNQVANAAIGFMSATGTSASFGSRGAGDYSGNVSMDQVSLAPNRSDAFMNQYTNALGTSTTDLQTGDFRYAANLGRGAASLGNTIEISSRLSTASANAERMATQESEAAQQTHAATLSTILSETHKWGSDKTYGDAWRHGDNASLATKIDRMNKISDQIKSDLGITDSETAARVLEASIKLQGSFGTPGALSAVTGLAASINASAGATGRQVSTEEVQATLAKAHMSAREAGITDTHTLADEFVKSQEFQKRLHSGDDGARQIQAAHQDTLTHTQAAQKSHEQASEYRQSAEKVMAMAARGEINWIPEFHNYVRRHALNAPGEYGIRDMGELTGDKATYWMAKFFAEGEMGRALDGSPVWMERAGLPPNRQPMTPEANAGLGGAYAALGVPAIDGTPVTAGTVATQHEKDKGLVPEVPGWQDPKTKGAPLVGQVEAAKGEAEQEEARTRAEVGATQQADRQAYKDRSGSTSYWNNHLGDKDPLTGQPTDKNAVARAKDGASTGGASGKW
ncbi:conjugal transfer protein TraG N-terminal domain-containing protein [Parasulfuritortus cantonensis]|uniref:conjugal transfer protein TraG N-terminal domain-containing protein n=1 Tax=Parasulfuritortus cantonensis TaxID=2528202 RepID=UPI0014047307|nr:conjugal transfer protein TraG N-terminal domain-containing protein [Parasulfuritortus cantonensis]